MGLHDRLLGQSALDAVPETAPFAQLADYAHARGISLHGIAPGSASDGLKTGDRAVYLVEVAEGGQRRQWLAEITADSLTRAELSARPAIADTVRFTTTGTELRYHAASLAALKIAVTGPFFDRQAARAAAAAQRIESRVVVSPDYLGLGLDVTCRVWLQVRDNLKKRRSEGPLASDLTLRLEASTKPFPERMVEETRRMAALAGFFPEDERPFFGMELALEQFARIAQAAPAASGPFFSVVEKPSWWSQMTHLGVDWSVTSSPRDIERLDGRPWGAGGPVFRLPFTLLANGQAALEGDMAVTSPRPPLLLCAGILGIAAHDPSSAERLLALRLLSAECHASSGSPAVAAGQGGQSR